MSATTVSPSAAAGPRLYHCGTLSYTQRQLYNLFFWLCWNDFTLTLLQDPTIFGGFLQKDYGATNAQIAIFGIVGTILNVIINPVFSVWSDRTRTKWGRRRPFLLICTPPLALFTMVMPYMPTITHNLEKHGIGTSLLHAIPVNSTVFMIGVCTLLIGFFNSIVGTLFSYLYWDTVPQEVLGRWTSLRNIISALCQLLWQFFFFGLADKHLKSLCVGVSLFALVVYLLSIVMVQEGGYGRVDPHKKGGAAFASVRAFFVECFSNPFYLWVYAASGFAAINWSTGTYIDFYLRYNLHLNYEMMGPLKGAPGILTILLGYFVGSLTDKLHPIRVFAPSYFLLGVIYVASFLFVHDQWSYLVWSCITNLGQFFNGVSYGALLPLIYPREKFGQFCSANATCSLIINLLIGLPLGWMFDWLHSEYRYAYLVAAFSMFGAAALFLVVQRSFNRRHGHVPVPHAG